MDEISIQLAYSKLNVASYALAISLDDIQKKYPKRTDLIESMSKHLEGIREAMIAFKSLESDNRTLNRLNFNYHKQNMELKYEIEKLKSNEIDMEL